MESSGEGQHNRGKEETKREPTGYPWLQVLRGWHLFSGQKQFFKAGAGLPSAFNHPREQGKLGLSF